MRPKLPLKFSKKTNEVKEDVNTLLIDGNSLFKTSYHGAKSDFNKNGVHIGGIYQFLTVVRKLMNETVYHKAFVFWDGAFSGKLRYDIYEDYKSDRGKDFINGSEPVEEGYLDQQRQTMYYLDALYIKQLMDDIVESDDFIAQYVKDYSKDEKITICTNDSDMVQLVNENVRIYNCGSGKKFYIDHTNYQEKMKHYPGNAKLIKVISGDTSDSIKGIVGVKETTLLKHFPMLTERKCELNEILTEAKTIQENRKVEKKKPLQALTNIIEGKTQGIQKDVYKVNEALVDLSNPLITNEAKNALKELKTATMEPNEERGMKEVFRMMKDDGLMDLIRDRNVDEYLLTFKKFIERRKDNV